MKLIITESQLTNIINGIVKNESVKDIYKNDDDDSSEIIEGDIEYGDYLLNYKVEYHEDFGYQVLEVKDAATGESVEDLFDEKDYEEVLDLIYDDVKPKRISYKEIETQYVAIDIRNGRVIHRSKNPIDRGFVSEFYDIPKRYIEITQK